MGSKETMEVWLVVLFGRDQQICGGYGEGQFFIWGLMVSHVEE